MAATPDSPLADLIPVKLPDSKSTFHRDFTGQELTAAGAQSILCRLDDDPARNLERWKKMPHDGQLAGSGRSQARRHRAARIHSHRAGSPSPLLVTENYGRGRTAVFATGGSWRWKMWQDHADKTHATFWQQMFRYLVTDTPGQVTSSTPKSGAGRRHPRAPARRGARQGIQAREQRQGAGPLPLAGRLQRHR